MYVCVREKECVCVCFVVCVCVCTRARSCEPVIEGSVSCGRAAGAYGRESVIKSATESDSGGTRAPPHTAVTASCLDA